MTEWNWPGSRWWKCDFHIHSRGSHDFQDPDDSDEGWVRAAHNAGLHAVAVTDHNSGEWVDRLKRKAEELGLPLTVFPGVEVTVTSNLHLLVLYDPSLSGSAVSSLLGRCDILNEMIGNPDATTTCSVHDALKHALRPGDGGLPIPAHVDGPKGLLSGDIHTNEEKSVLRRVDLCAVEYLGRDPAVLSKLDGTDPEYRRDNRVSRVVFSDAHRLTDIGRRFTWIKMTRPEVEGLRLAFIDGNGAAVLRDDEVTGDPNTHADNCIESISISGTKLIGRQAPFILDLNPWFNALIGGRGSGKSTILEFVRHCLERGDELPPKLKEDFENVVRVPDGRRDMGLLTDQAELEVIYRKQGTRYRIRWVSGNSSTEEEQQDGAWQGFEAVVPSFFPIQMYSQKQIFQIAEDPNALLNIIDQSQEVDKGSWDQSWKEKEQEFRRLRAELRQLEVRLEEDVKLRGELKDVQRRIRVFQKQGHEAILTEYQKRRGQQTDVNAIVGKATAFFTDVEQLYDQLPGEPSLSLPASITAEEDADGSVGAALAKMTESLKEAKSAVNAAVAQLKGSLDEAGKQIEGSAWRALCTAADKAYTDLVSRLEAEGAGSPLEYEGLLKEEERIQKKIQDLQATRDEHQKKYDHMNDVYHNQLIPLRVDLSKKRSQFISSVLAGNQYVRIRLKPLDDVAEAVRGFRSLIKREGQFASDIFDSDRRSGVFYALQQNYPSQLNEGVYQPGSTDWNTCVHQVLGLVAQKQRDLASIARGGSDATVQDLRFANCLQQEAKDNQAFIDELLLLFPGDTLSVEYSATGDGAGFTPIRQGSPGQKTAAILAFILSHGNDPLFLDQPEDDLDNRLISKLIVKQIQENKKKRQLFVITHNPNIVVNGDADMVFALESHRGQTRISLKDQQEAKGGLQEKRVRQEICDVMEGGREAFQRRYSRVGRQQ
jgi:predicted metal-dependent phosphoesterase TrpH